jgi:hypothetical protein
VADGTANHGAWSTHEHKVQLYNGQYLYHDRQAVQLITVLGVLEHKIQLYNGHWTVTVPGCKLYRTCTCNSSGTEPVLYL